MEMLGCVFNDVKGNYDATMTVIRYGLQLSWILRLYALHVTHIDTQPCKLAELFFIWTSHIIVLLLYRHRTHSHYITSNIIHINLLRFATHIISCLNFLTGKGINRQVNKTNIAGTYFLNSKYQTFESSSFDRHNISDGSNYGQFSLRILSSYGKGWNKYRQL